MNTDSHRKVSLSPLFFRKILSVLSESSDHAPIQSIFWSALLETAVASHNFVWIMVISLNVLFFYLIFRYGKRNKTHSTDSGDEGGCGMTVILFSQKYGHKVELTGALLWPRNQFLTFNFSDNFSFRILRTDPHKIPNMLATSWMAILLFSKTLYLAWSHFHLFCSLMVVLSIQHLQHRPIALEIGRPPTCILSVICCPKATSTFWNIL